MNNSALSNQDEAAADTTEAADSFASRRTEMEAAELFSYGGRRAELRDWEGVEAGRRLTGQSGGAR
jgi:hypothetical protein